MQKVHIYKTAQIDFNIIWALILKIGLIYSALFYSLVAINKVVGVYVASKNDKTVINKEDLLEILNQCNDLFLPKVNEALASHNQLSQFHTLKPISPRIVDELLTVGWANEQE